MKKLLFSAFIMMQCALGAQDYTITPLLLNATGDPGDLMLDSVRVDNNSAATIQLFVNRYSKVIPSGWQTCFCYPFCLSPVVDTFTFAIGGFSSKKIGPGFFSDSIPGMGTTWTQVYQYGYASQADTIIFTASTLSTNSNAASPGWGQFVSVNPNPSGGSMSITGLPEGMCFASVISIEGKRVAEERLVGPEAHLDLTNLETGTYFLLVRDEKMVPRYFKIILAR